MIRRIGRGAGWRLALTALLLLLLPEQVTAQPNDEKAVIDTSVFVLPDEDGDAPPPQPLEPVPSKPLTSADLPPSNPLVGRFSRMNIPFGRNWLPGRNQYRGIVEREASAAGLPPAFVDAIMAVESGYNPASIGFDGEIGLMQIMLPTARMLGFTGTPAELAIPETNVHYGAKYLAGAWRRADGDLCTAAMKYRAGHGETRFSFLSVDYCLRVRGHLAAHGVAVTGSVPQPTFGSRGGRPATGGRSVSRSGSVDLAGLNTRLRALTDRKGAQTSN